MTNQILSSLGQVGLLDKVKAMIKVGVATGLILILVGVFVIVVPTYTHTTVSYLAGIRDNDAELTSYGITNPRCGANRIRRKRCLHSWRTQNI